MKIYYSFCFIVFSCLLNAQPIQVNIIKNASGNYELTRLGEPYYIVGAGGHSQLEYLRSIGGNSIRTWSTDNAKQVLDEAQKNGLTVMMGLWVQHERHGFDYDDASAVQKQLDQFRKVVVELKDHPALLLWAVGNEVDLNYSNTKVWDAVNDISTMIKELDPNHPTTTVTAGLDSSEVRLIQQRCPSIDIYSINTYGEIADVADDLKSYGWKGPFLITEWGPNGHWEVEKTSWKAPIEQNSTEKYDSYFQRYTEYIKPKENCLGSYVFLWGQKQETTPTWYGLFTESGLPTSVTDALYSAWTGRSPLKPAPIIVRAEIVASQSNGEYFLLPDQDYDARVTFEKYKAKQVNIHWELLPESTDIKSGGDKESKPLVVENAIQSQRDNELKFKTPSKEGAYRLFVYVEANDKVAYANIPIFISATEGK